MLTNDDVIRDFNDPIRDREWARKEMLAEFVLKKVEHEKSTPQHGEL